jgi:hypothetical protein
MNPGNLAADWFSPLVAQAGGPEMMPSVVGWLVKILSVIGGAAIGALAVGFAARRLGKWVGMRDARAPALNALRVLGAVAGGWVVWLVVFGPGSGPFGGGGGSFFGSHGQGEGSGKTGASSAVATAKSASPQTFVAPRHAALRITILGGARVANERFYLVEGEKEPRTLAELKTVLKEQQQKAGVMAVELLIYENSVARNHPAVKELEQWAQQSDLTVTIPPTRGVIP